MSDDRTLGSDEQGVERRAFLRKVGLGAAFAAPVVASFSMNGSAMASQILATNVGGSNAG